MIGNVIGQERSRLAVRLSIFALCSTLLASCVPIILLWRLTQTIEIAYSPEMSPLLAIYRYATTPALAVIGVAVGVILGVAATRSSRWGDKKFACVMIALIVTTMVLALLTSAGIVGLHVLIESRL